METLGTNDTGRRQKQQETRQTNKHITT
jgi:hypothetical protein